MNLHIFVVFHLQLWWRVSLRIQGNALVVWQGIILHLRLINGIQFHVVDVPIAVVSLKAERVMDIDCI